MHVYISVCVFVCLCVYHILFYGGLCSIQQEYEIKQGKMGLLKNIYFSFNDNVKNLHHHLFLIEDS